MSTKNPIVTIMVWNGRLLMFGALLLWALFGAAAVAEGSAALTHWQFYALMVTPLLWMVPGFLMQRMGTQLRAPASSVSMRA